MEEGKWAKLLPYVPFLKKLENHYFAYGAMEKCFHVKTIALAIDSNTLRYEDFQTAELLVKHLYETAKVVMVGHCFAGA